MAEKIRVVAKEKGNPAEIREIENDDKVFLRFLGDSMLEIHDHPTMQADFIIGFESQSWDKPATIILGEKDTALGGNILVVKRTAKLAFDSFTETEAEEVLQDIRKRELNHTETNLAMAKFDIRQAKRFSQGLKKAFEMD